VEWLADDETYFVLEVSQNQTRLLQGNGSGLKKVDVRDLPRDLTSALDYDVAEGAFQAHSGEPRLKGKEGMVFHGQGGGPDDAKQEIVSYFRLIDQAVTTKLEGDCAPLIFAGVDYLFPLYREANHYPHLLSQHIGGSPDRRTSSDLLALARPLIGSLISARRETAANYYWTQVSHGRTANRLDDVLRTAAAGAIETLLIDSGAHCRGQFDPTRGTAYIHEGDAPEDEDLLNLAVCLVLCHGGEVVVAPKGHVPGGGLFAAVLRYPADTLAPPVEDFAR
jgi:hypothetical protein